MYSLFRRATKYMEKRDCSAMKTKKKKIALKIIKIHIQTHTHTHFCEVIKFKKRNYESLEVYNENVQPQ